MKSRRAISSNGNPVHDIVVIGGSAGALDAMVELVRGLPADYGGSLFVVSHIGANPSQLPALLGEAGRLAAAFPRHMERIAPGRIYVAPPDRHLLLADGKMLLSALPREHFTRPAIDPLFRSAARAYGPRVVGVVLSGTGSDGASGLVDIRKAGGVAVVQDPQQAPFPEMPRFALRAAAADHIVPAAELAALLTALAETPAAAARVDPDPEDATELEGPVGPCAAA